MRITHKMLASVPRKDLQAALRRLNEAQEALTSGQRITRPSQDPVSAGRVTRAARAIAELDERDRTLDAGGRTLSQATSLANYAARLVRRARDIALRAASSNTLPEVRLPLAKELDSIIQRLVDIGNARFDGRYLFGGHQTLDRPFDYSPGGVPTYNGDAGERLVPVSPGNQIPVSLPGSVLFNVGGAGNPSEPDVLASLAALRDAVQAGPSTAIPGPLIDDLNEGEAYVLNVASDLAGRQQRLEQAKSRNADARLDLNRILSEEAGTDIAQAVLDLKAQEVAYEAALAAAGQVVSSPSLLNFLR